MASHNELYLFDSFASSRAAVVAASAPPRVLFVLEVQEPSGAWFAMPGDAYLDEGEAERRQRECLQRTRIVRYVPEGAK